MGYNEIFSPSSPQERRTSLPQILTPYQVASILTFSDCHYTNGKTTVEPFTAVDGLVNEDGCDSLSRLAQKSFDSLIGLEVDQVTFPNLTRVARELEEPESAQILNHLGQLAYIRVVASKDLETEQAFAELPLVVQYCLSHAGENVYGRIKDLLTNKQGVLAVTVFHKPSPAYLEATDHTEGDTMIAKVQNAFVSPSDEVKKASHQFISISAVPPDNTDTRLIKEANDISKFLNLRIDNSIEEKYARAMVTKAMLNEEMKGAMYGMVGVVGVLPLLFWINQHAPDNMTAQALIKFIPPFIADIVTFWAQLSPWLEGDTFSERSKDFYKKITTTHLRSALLSLGATAVGSYGAEYVTEQHGAIPGSVVYSGIPFAVAMATTIDTIKSLRKKMPNLNLNEIIQVMFTNNPAHLGIDIGAAATFLTGLGVLGFKGQIHNPLALGLIEGAEEHTIAAGFTYLQSTFGQLSYVKQEMRSRVDKWKDRKWQKNNHHNGK